MKSAEESPSLIKTVRNFVSQIMVSIPQMPRLELLSKSQIGGQEIYQNDSIRRAINIIVISLSTVCLVCQNLVAFDPSLVSQELTLWTMITCNLASTSLFELVILLLLLNFVIN
jgi:hypothetical protein